MGKRKRSHHDESDYRSIKKKFKKLERRLQKYRRSSSSSFSDSGSAGRDGPKNLQADSYESVEEYRSVQDINDLQVDGELNENDDKVLPISPTNESPPDEEILDPEVLMMLGDDHSKEKEYGDNLHKDIAGRWSHILLNGLSKEVKSEIIKQYLPSSNCINMKAPKLNLEIEAALSPLNVKKDAFSQSKQNQLSSCLSAIGVAMNYVLMAPKDTVPQIQNIIKPLSDAGRLLCDSHYRESQSRRYAIINSLNKKTQDAVRNTKLDEALFGANLAEHLKSTKAISQSGAEMKYSAGQRPLFKPAQTTRKTQRGALNLRGMSRPAAGEPRQNPNFRRPAAASKDHRRDTYRRSQSSRQRPTRR